MSEKTSYPIYQENCVASEHYSQVIENKRTKCVICDYNIDEKDESIYSEFNCNIRAFQKEAFKVWRCPKCKTIHTLDIVDIAPYYKEYPIADAKLTWEMRLCYGKLARQLFKHGFTSSHSILDYGCANGLFINYLQQQGFEKCYGYEPYTSEKGFANEAVLLDFAPFNFILLQDVIEHVEDPRKLLSKLDGLLAPGGYILIGTPNAENIDLTKPNISDFYNCVHVPYHFHIYTPQVLEHLGNGQNWQAIEFRDRAYHDTPWLGVNTRAWNQYQQISDGSLDAIHEPIDLNKAVTSYKVMFYAFFGYWLSYHTEMSMMFRKI